MNTTTPQETWNQRLAAAVKSRGITRTAFAKAVRRSGATVTAWLNDETSALQAEDAVRICEVLNIQLDWLLFGMDAPDGDATDDSGASFVRVKIRNVPVLNYQQVKNLNAVPLAELRGQVEHAPVAVRHSENTFGLRIQGDAMEKPSGVRGRSFPHGMMIFVDPEQSPKPDDYVLAQLDNDQVVFRQLQEEEGAKVLVALNTDREAFPVVRSGYTIIGKVIDASYGGL